MVICFMLFLRLMVVFVTCPLVFALFTRITASVALMASLLPLGPVRGLRVLPLLIFLLPLLLPRPDLAVRDESDRSGRGLFMARFARFLGLAVAAFVLYFVVLFLSPAPRALVWSSSGLSVVRAALTPSQMMRGLSGPRPVSRSHRLLFVFFRPIRAGFWMRVTYYPLRVSWFSVSGSLVSSAVMPVHLAPPWPRFYPARVASFAFEAPPASPPPTWFFFWLFPW